MQKFLEKYVETSQMTYWPAPFIFNGLLQSIFAITRRFPASFKLPYEREVVILRDGGQVGLDFLPPESINDSRYGYDQRHDMIRHYFFHSTLVFLLNKLGFSVVF